MISICVGSVSGAKLMSPSNLEDLDSVGELIHITVNSAVFGFIDDMYMQTDKYFPEGKEGDEARKIRLQSQLRIG